ncbi:MAG: GMP synthase [Saprospiraceae bacterium]
MKKFQLALLDLYAGEANQGMRAIKGILADFKDQIELTIFDVRSKCEIPDTSFDIYISSGGPGHPQEGDGIWDAGWKDLMDRLWLHNLKGDLPKKHVFFICHSFQMICDHFAVGEITKRRKKSFGTFPTHKTIHGKKDCLLKNLPDPFWIADFREYQVVQPDYEVLDAIGAKILCLEKVRPHVPYERALMAIRFSNEFFGTNFHPEADPDGMREHFMQKERMDAVVDEFGKRKYMTMIRDLNDPEKIPLTHQMILPGFLSNAVRQLKEVPGRVLEA